MGASCLQFWGAWLRGKILGQAFGLDVCFGCVVVSPRLLRSLLAANWCFLSFAYTFGCVVWLGDLFWAEESDRHTCGQNLKLPRYHGQPSPTAIVGSRLGLSPHRPPRLLRPILGHHCHPHQAAQGLSYHTQPPISGWQSSRQV